MEGQTPLSLPSEPTLAATALALNETGHWGEIVDHRWRCVYLTHEARRSYGGPDELAPYPVGAMSYSSEYVRALTTWRSGLFPLKIIRRLFDLFGPWMLADTPGGREELRDLVDPGLVDLVDQLPLVNVPPAAPVVVRGMYTHAGEEVDIPNVLLRLRNPQGKLVGTAVVSKPAAGMAVLATMAAIGDLEHFARMQTVAKAARRPAAILFADIERSSRLSRRLSTATYFALGRRMARAADRCIIDSGGLVGRHVGDGSVGFFLAEVSGSESAAARACITAARNMRAATLDVATQIGLPPEDLIVRFGLHWGSTLYVGQIATSGRTEVTALGDEVNDCARIEACATGGRVLASKELIERLSAEDAAALGLASDRVAYVALGDLPHADEKARRDAPLMAVCEI